MQYSCLPVLFRVQVPHEDGREFESQPIKINDLSLSTLALDIKSIGHKLGSTLLGYCDCVGYSVHLLVALFPCVVTL